MRFRVRGGALRAGARVAQSRLRRFPKRVFVVGGARAVGGGFDRRRLGVGELSLRLRLGGGAARGSLSHGARVLDRGGALRARLPKRLLGLRLGGGDALRCQRARALQRDAALLLALVHLDHGEEPFVPRLRRQQRRLRLRVRPGLRLGELRGGAARLGGGHGGLNRRARLLGGPLARDALALLLARRLQIRGGDVRRLRLEGGVRRRRGHHLPLHLAALLRAARLRARGGGHGGVLARGGRLLGANGLHPGRLRRRRARGGGGGARGSLLGAFRRRLFATARVFQRQSLARRLLLVLRDGARLVRGGRAGSLHTRRGVLGRRAATRLRRCRAHGAFPRNLQRGGGVLLGARHRRRARVSVPRRLRRGRLEAHLLVLRARTRHRRQRVTRGRGGGLGGRGHV